MGTTASPPLAVDLDGSLIRSDLLHESAISFFRTQPWSLFRIPMWLRQGKARLKHELAARARIDPALLPYNAEFLGWLVRERDNGRSLVLCTASSRTLADAVAGHCGIFDEVIASDQTVNLDGHRKAQALVDRYGARGFDYAGNAPVDLAIWERARRAIVVNAPRSLAVRAGGHCEVEKVFERAPASAATWLRMLRVHHWLKNALLFVPLFAAHQIADGAAWLKLVLAFAAFSLCASSVYAANDLMDLESDRRHPRKRSRPFASGAIPVSRGVLLVPALAVGGFLLAAAVGSAFTFWLGVYFALTWAYSWWLKRMVLLDCIALAALYTLRVIAGAAAAALTLSFWLLAFSAFLFLSLSFVKRYAELLVQQAAGNEKLHGRGYRTADAPLIQALGVAAAYTSVVVLALYLNSDAILRLYPSPGMVWASVPILAYWVSWMWLRASRGEMHDDPLVFAFRDRTSLVAGGLFGASMLLGSLGAR